MNDFFRLSVEFTFGALLRFVRAEKAVSFPHRLLFQCRLSLLEEKECKETPQTTSANNGVILSNKLTSLRLF